LRRFCAMITTGPLNSRYPSALWECRALCSVVEQEPFQAFCYHKMSPPRRPGNGVTQFHSIS
jgi:hypothetical protein